MTKPSNAFITLFERAQALAPTKFKEREPKSASRVSDHDTWAASEINETGIRFTAEISACLRGCCGSETVDVFITWKELDK